MSNEPATVGDVQRIERSTERAQNTADQAHNRIDAMTADFSTMKGDIHEIKGCITPLCNNVESITDAILQKGVATSNNGSSSIVLLKIVDLIKWFVVASVIGGVISAVGYYGIKAAAKQGDSEIRIEKTE